MPSGTLHASRPFSACLSRRSTTWIRQQEGLLSRVVICPSCGSKGSVPDNAPAARIRCPACKAIFEVGGSASQSSAVVPKPSTGARRPAAASSQSSAFDDLEPVRPLAPASNTGFRRSPAEPSKGSGPSPLIYALLGVSGVAVVLLVVVLAVVLTRGGDGPAANGGDTARLRNDPNRVPSSERPRRRRRLPSSRSSRHQPRLHPRSPIVRRSSAASKTHPSTSS